MTKLNAVAPFEEVGSIVFSVGNDENTTNATNNNHEKGIDGFSVFTTLSTNNGRVPFLHSIKFCIILLIGVAVLTSVTIISGIWLAALLPSNFEWSQKGRDYEFKRMINSVSDLLVDVTQSLNVMKGQLWSMMDFTNAQQIELATYQTFKAEKQHHKGLVVTVYVGDPTGAALGIYYERGVTTFLNMSLDAQISYNCDSNIEKYDYCKRSSTPSDFFDPVDLSALTDKSPFRYYLAYDLTVASASEFLIETTRQVSSSKSFIFETETNYLVAIDNPNLKSAFLNQNKEIVRNTIFSLKDDRTTQVATTVYQALLKDFKSLPCNTMTTLDLTFSSDYISVNRLCTSTQVDWIFVMAIPKWSFLSSIIIGIVSSVCGAFLLVIVAISFSSFISWKIVSPFYNLIQQFDSISHMILDNIHIQPSKFSEVKLLQQHFMNMAHYIRLYRAFIPPHLLSQLDYQDAIEESETMVANNNLSLLQTSRQLNRSNAYKTEEEDDMEAEIISEKSSFVGKESCSHHPRHKKNQAVDHLFSLFLEKKPVTIVNLVLVEFSELLKNVSNPNDCLALLTDVFEQIAWVSRTTSGFIGSFENDSITLSFNSTTSQLKHQEKGAQAAKLLLDKLTLVKEKKWSSHVIRAMTSRRSQVTTSSSGSKPPQQAQNQESTTSTEMDLIPSKSTTLPPQDEINHNYYEKMKHLLNSVKLHIAICSQECIVGNVGSSELKSTVCISSASHNLELMIHTAQQLCIPIVVSESIQQQVRNGFYTRYLETLPFIIDNEYSSVVQILGYSTQDDMDKRRILQAVYELGDVKTMSTPQEYTQRVSTSVVSSSSGEETKCMKWRMYEEACEVMLIQKDYERALKLFESFLKEMDEGEGFSNGTEEPDRPTLRWMEHCKKNISSHDE
ncbi:hypothetical protein C9374_003936 [Naegleria lovaniensis]|uniref:Guanylate cyclase domain-containing protein n=1 Tax=Naegleria lovaniensis TaxID=51637 RepID=A0AA88H8V2_NAELO|nr:uncharacterized protein C9374_003936 [Naegleria lovaniensis]KAG2394172.1 hypothetical protein C9374_003936 [Naegleria lovaniensis]